MPPRSPHPTGTAGAVVGARAGQHAKTLTDRAASSATSWPLIINIHATADNGGRHHERPARNGAAQGGDRPSVASCRGRVSGRTGCAPTPQRGPAAIRGRPAARQGRDRVDELSREPSRDAAASADSDRGRPRITRRTRMCFAAALCPLRSRSLPRPAWFFARYSGALPTNTGAPGTVEKTVSVSVVVAPDRADVGLEFVRSIGSPTLSVPFHPARSKRIAAPSHRHHRADQLGQVGDRTARLAGVDVEQRLLPVPWTRHRRQKSPPSSCPSGYCPARGPPPRSCDPTSTPSTAPCRHARRRSCRRSRLRLAIHRRTRRCN